jgi:hypothetical protein
MHSQQTFNECIAQAEVSSLVGSYPVQVGPIEKREQRLRPHVDLFFFF